MPAFIQWSLLALAGIALLWLWFKHSGESPLVLAIKLAITAGLIFAMAKIGLHLYDGRDSAIMGMIFIWVLAMVLAVLWTPNITGFFGGLLGSLYDGGSAAAEPVPLYSIAHARRAAGKYREAISEIQKQLEKFPNDFMGQMLIATIQAENLQDLAAAQNSIERIVSQPGQPQKIAAALTHLADWQLQLGDNPAAARATFERIVALLPGTEQAQLATQRLAHLEDYRTTKDIRRRGTIALRTGERDLGLKPGVEIQPPVETPPAAAARLVEHLRLHPADWEAREQLATIYADHYQRLDLALGEFEQLIAEPHQPAKHVARWFNRVAEFHLQRNDLPAARAALQRLADRFPNTAPAELARNRLATLETSARSWTKREGGVALGKFGRDLGLKDGHQ